MKKKSALLIMILFISTFSYGRINNIRQNNIFLQQVRKQEDTLPRKVVHDFYKWYINDIYMKDNYSYTIPSYKKYGPKKYGLDIITYKKKILSIPYFSNNYKIFLIKRCEKCNKDMLSDLWDEEPEPFFNIPSCSFLWKLEWFGNQEEKNNKFTILPKVKRYKNNYYYYVQSYIVDEKFTLYKIRVVKEESKFKIDHISTEN